MFKNTSGQKLTVFAFDSTTNLPKTGDAANITAYRDLDDGGVTVLTDTSATEKDATNAKGYYIFDLSQAETNGDKILFSAKSSTGNIVVVAVPAVVYTFPATGILAPATAGRTLVVDASGLADANMVKVGPTGSGTTQTAADLGLNIYTARIWQNKDTSVPQDEYTVVWYKNNIRVTSGITSPTIEIIKRVDGTDLLAATTMTQVGTTGSYKYDATGSNRLTDGESAIIVVAATIDGSAREYSEVFGRDA